jgi:hypothetical protein
MPLYGQSSGSPPRFMHRRRPDRRPGWATFSPAFPWIVVIHLLWGMGDAFFRAFVPAAKALSGI